MSKFFFIRPKRLFHFLFLWALVVLLTGCAESASNTASDSPLPSPTLSPTPDLTPSPDDIALIYQQSLSHGEVLIVEAVNVSDIPYVFYESPDDNCLFVQKDVFFSTRPPETCDVLAEKIIEPGQRRFFGSWDLLICTDLDCLTRTEAAPDSYFFEATFYPYRDGDSQPSDGTMINNIGADFVIEEGAD